MKNNLVTLFKNYETIKKALNETEEKWENNPENLELEKEFDSLYKQQYIIFDELINELLKIVNNKIEEKVARKMLVENYTNVKNLMLKVA